MAETYLHTNKTDPEKLFVLLIPNCTCHCMIPYANRKRIRYENIVFTLNFLFF